MAHPFFDAAAWPASRPDAQAFEDALVFVFDTGPRINAVYTKVADNLDPLNLVGTQIRDIWVSAIKNIMLNGKLRTFCEQLQANDNPVLKTALAAVFAATPAFEQRVLSSGVLVVDRGDLRSKLALIVARDSPASVLLVRGAPKSGKSHGYYLFEAAAREAGAEPVYLGRDIVFTVPDVYRELFAMVGGVPEEIATGQNTTGPAWYQVVCSRLLQAANEHNVQLWIGVDDLGPDEKGAPLIDAEILLFFKQFGAAMKAPQYRSRFRLMLIHFAEIRPTAWATLWCKEADIAIDEIKEESLVDFLRGWSRDRGKVIVEEQIASLSQEVMTALDAPDPKAVVPAGAPPGTPAPPERPRLERLYELMEAMTQKLAQA